MTRTGLSPRLSSHLAEPFLDIHPGDAARLGLSPADLVEVTSPTGRAILRLRITAAQRPGEVFAPMHWTGETAPTARIDALVAGETDPVSGQPESKAAVAQVARFGAAWYGFAVAAAPMDLTADYWALARTTTGWRAELAGTRTPADWEAEARRLFRAPEADALSLLDPARGLARVALFARDRLIGALFVAATPVAVMRDYLTTLPGSAEATVLSGRPPAGRPDPGPTLCACFDIGVNTIVSAIEADGLATVEAVGAALGAGSNCGSCRPEIATLLARLREREAAE